MSVLKIAITLFIVFCNSVSANYVDIIDIDLDNNIDKLCDSTEFKKVERYLHPQTISYVRLYCFRKMSNLFDDGFDLDNNIDKLCNIAEFKKNRNKLDPEMISYVNLYCFKKAIELICDTQRDIFSKEDEQDESQEVKEYYRKRHAYEKRGLVFNCNDSLNFKERKIDPRPKGGFTDRCFFFDGRSSYEKFNDTLKFKHEDIAIYTDDDGTKRVSKTIRCGNFREEIITIRNKKGRILLSKHYKWNDNMLIQTIENGTIRKIIPGKTRCDFTIIEPSGDSVYFYLDPNKELDDSIKVKNDSRFFDYMNEPEFEAGKYDAIIYNYYNWRSLCEGYQDSEKPVETPVSHLEQENEPNIKIESDNISLSYPPPYKYYAIISICIIAASIVAIRRKWRTKK
jgi:hypothetical protein